MSKLLIIVGTETGTAEGVAIHLEKALSDSYTVEVSLSATVADLLRDPEELLVFCTANTGAGDLPENIEPLYNALQSESPDIAGRPYALITLGDSMYSTFGEAGEKLEEALQKLGASPIADSLLIDTGEDRYPQKIALDWLKEQLS